MDNIGSKDATTSFELDESKNIFNIIFYRFVPFWPIFTVSIIACLVIAHYYLHYQTPIYQASASILLKEDKSSEGQDNLLEALDVFSSKKIVENELEVLKSRTLMSKVVTDMGLYAQIYVKGNVRDVLSYPSSPVSFVALYPAEIKSHNEIPFDYLEKENVVLLNNKRYPVGVPVHTPYGDFKINLTKADDSLSGGYNREKKAMYLQLTAVKSLTKSFLGKLSTSASSKESTVIDLEIRDPSPARAEAILNNLMRVYTQAEIDDKNTIAANTLAFIEGRLKIVTAELSQVEGNIQNYKSREGIVDVSKEGELYLESAKDEDKSLADVQIQLDVLDQVEKYVLKKGSQSGTVPAVAEVTDPILKELLVQLYTDELKLTELRKFTGENSPSVIGVKSQIEQLKPSILENLRNLRQNFLATQTKIQSDIGKLRDSLKGIPQKERALLEISRQQFIKNNIYTYLLQKREETALAYASTVADNRIIDHADTASSPVAPVSSSIYLVALAVGLAIPIFMVLLKEQLNSNILFRSEIEKATSIPVIAEILYDLTGDAIVVKDGKRTVIAEQFRSIRTSLSFLGTKTDKRVVLLTSSVASEGKSFIAVNLAITLALASKKVALLELDLRKPKLSKILGIDRKIGIADYLAGLTTIDEIVKPVADVPDLFVLPCGTKPPNPTELILNGRLDVLIEHLRKDFDWILIDSPPVGLVTDAKLLNVYADMSLYIIRHDFTPKVYLKMMEGLYLNNELASMNIIFNGLKPRGVFGYGFAQGYGYGYGYGHGYGYDYGNGGGYVENEKGKFWSLFNFWRKQGKR